jgi:multidrug efflux pump subunit AcrA (membrane-fusion protein)
MKRWVWAATALVLVIGFVAYRQLSAGKKELVYKTEPAKISRIRRVVSGTGNIEYTAVYNIISQENGTVDQMPINEKSAVKTGQELFSVNGNPVFALNGDTPIYRILKSGDSGKDVEVLQKSLKELGYSIDEIDGDFGSNTRTRLKNFQDDKDLTKTGTLNPQSFQAFPLPLNVIDLPVKQGDRIAAGQTIATLADIIKLKAVVLVNEIDVPQIKVGQQAVITIDALPGKEYTGKVTFISEQPAGSSNQQSSASSSSTTGVVNYSVEVLLDKPSAEIKSGMTANADIVIEEKPSALVVPSAAIKEANGKKFVELLNGKQQKKIEVKTGIYSENQVEILSGIKQGDKVVTAVKESTQGSAGSFRLRPPG